MASLPSPVCFLGCFQLCCVIWEEQPDGVWKHELAQGLGRQGCWLQGLRGLGLLGTKKEKSPFGWKLTLECSYIQGST